MLKKIVVLHSPVKEIAILLIALDYSNYFVFRSKIRKKPPTPTPCTIVIVVIIIVIPAAWRCWCQHWCRILPPPPPCAMVVVVVVPVFLPTAGRCQRCILLPPLPHIFVFVPVFLPATGQYRASTSTSYPTTATATHNLRRCHRPCPCPCCLSTSCFDIASSRPHRHVQSLLSLLSPTLSMSPLPVNVESWQCRRRSRILPPPPPPCATIVVVIVMPVFLSAAGRCRHRILPPPLPRVIVFVPAFLPTTGQCCGLHVDIDVASYCCHRHGAGSRHLGSIWDYSECIKK